MPISPLGKTASVGVNAGTVALALTRTGVLHVAPPSVDVASAIESRAPLVKRESCQAAYKVPLPGCAAKVPRISPALTATDACAGRRVPTASNCAMRTGADHVTPLFVERITLRLPSVTAGLAADGPSSVKKTCTDPSGVVTATLPTVWRRAPGS